MKKSYVYMMCSKKNGTLYIGVTSNLSRRIYQHKKKLVPGFTAKYLITHLVYYETFDSIVVAIRREKQLKGWVRDRKIQLIEKTNPDWNDLYVEGD